MKAHRALARAFAAMTASLLGALALAAPLRAQDYTYGIEVNGVLCGYAETHESRARTESEEYTLVTEKVFVMQTLLGNRFETEINSTYHVVPGTGRCTYLENRIVAGDAKLATRIFITGDKARFVFPLEKKEKTIDLPPGAFLENPVRSPHLLRDFVERGARSASYSLIEAREAQVQETTYTLVRRETLELAGKRYEALVLDRLNRATGLKMRQWIHVDGGMALKVEIPGGRLIYLADPSVKKRIEQVNLDSTIAAKVDLVIADIQAIAYMKVRAVLEPTGLVLSAEDLNIPGQRFEGTVSGNRVEGVFTIEHPRFDGSGAPPFPPKFAEMENLDEYLAPGNLIESDDPVLAAHARKLTQGAQDSWSAAGRLSRWVAENIDYVIPGGVSARKTYDLRAGECGAHSLLLAALCRCVGIPARVVWGCMYVPNFGGAFCQHAWTEVYMGPAGWIPVDSTAFECDFVDSGHIRVGSYQSFSTAINMKEMEILEHRESSPGAEGGASTAKRLEPYLGKYAHPAGKEPFQVLVKGGDLAVNIPGQVVLALREPDERGRWYAKLTSRIYCVFPRDEGGRITALTIHEIVRMRRKADPEQVEENVPAELRPYLGTYRFTARRAEFTVLYDKGSLAVHDPMKNLVIHLKPSGEVGRWIDEYDKNTMSFEVDEKGVVKALLVDAANRFERQREVARIQPQMQAQVKAMLAAFHLAASQAKGERLFELIAPEAILMGTDPHERWTAEQFKALVAPSFDQGKGWTTTPIEQNVYLGASGSVAWFDERLRSADHGAMRGSGVARRIDGQWRIVQYNTAFPIPNEVFKNLVAKIAARPGKRQPRPAPVASAGASAAVKAVLVAFHRAASQADSKRFFELLAPAAICFGTDPAERFTVDQLRAFTAPRFSKGLGWTTLPTEQQIYLSPDSKVAWFDERLWSDAHGEMRGSGVLTRVDGRWKIVQYNLTLPVPNALVKELSKMLQGRSSKK